LRNKHVYDLLVIIFPSIVKVTQFLSLILLYLHFKGKEKRAQRTLDDILEDTDDDSQGSQMTTDVISQKGHSMYKHKFVNISNPLRVNIIREKN